MNIAPARTSGSTELGNRCTYTNTNTLDTYTIYTIAIHP